MQITIHKGALGLRSRAERHEKIAEGLEREQLIHILTGFNEMGRNLNPDKPHLIEDVGKLREMTTDRLRELFSELTSQETF